MITKSEREWIEEQSKDMTGETKRKFIMHMIDYFSRKRNSPKKPDFAEINWSEVLPGLIEPQKPIRRIK